jgi:hypothetical protein
MFPRSWLATPVILVLALAACERAATPRAGEQPAVADTSAPLPDSVSGTTDTDWRDENGPMLAIAGDSAGMAILVLPALDTPRTAVADLDSLNDLQVELFSVRGRVGTGRIQPRASPPNTGDDQCAEWPTARVIMDAQARTARWSIALASGSATALAMDSLAGMRQPDSTRLAAEIARLASTTPGDTAPLFRGLPFRVQTAYRVSIAPGVTVVVATVVRTINQEANARTEHLLILAEQEATGTNPRLTLRYSERLSGPEESTETTDILATLLVGPEKRPTIVLGRSDDSGSAFAFLERGEGGRWALHWNSPYTDC